MGNNFSYFLNRDSKLCCKNLLKMTDQKPNLRNQLLKRGYIIIPNLFSNDEIKEYRNEVDNYLKNKKK